MIGILYICTGKYDIFWKDFYLSAERFFLPGQEKRYFVFTDAAEIYAESDIKVKKLYQAQQKWPYSTLLRYEMFAAIKSDLKKFDYIFFLNANILFLEKVFEQILPGLENDGLVAVNHPYFWNQPADKLSYERDMRSCAAVKFGDGKHYFLGGINGGESGAYLKLIETLKRNISKDLKNGIIALWHDESHFNHYLIDKNPMVLNPSYGYPENYDLPFKPIISILDKSRFGGHAFLRHT